MHVRYVKLYEIYVTESETYKNYKNSFCFTKSITTGLPVNCTASKIFWHKQSALSSFFFDVTQRQFVAVRGISEQHVGGMFKVRWNRHVLLKRRQGTTTTRCVTARRAAVLRPHLSADCTLVL